MNTFLRTSSKMNAHAMKCILIFIEIALGGEILNTEITEIRPPRTDF